MMEHDVDSVRQVAMEVFSAMHEEVQQAHGVSAVVARLRDKNAAVQAQALSALSTMEVGELAEHADLVVANLASASGSGPPGSRSNRPSGTLIKQQASVFILEFQRMAAENRRLRAQLQPQLQLRTGVTMVSIKRGGLQYYSSCSMLC